MKARAPLHEEIAGRSRRRRKSLREQSAAAAIRTPRNDLRPDLKIKSWPIEELKAPKHAVRKLLTAQVDRLKGSISAFGMVEPILIRSDGEIVKGRTRVEAARALGLVDVPCIEIDHLSDTELRALGIALRRLGETGAWDFDVLRIELDTLLLLDAPVEAIGFSVPEIDALTLADEPNPALDNLPEAQTALPAVTQTGQVWRLGEHRILCGDARDSEVYARLLGEELVRFVFTDVPFNVRVSGHVTSGDHREFAMASGEMSREEFAAFNDAWIAACLARLTPGGLLATFIDWRSVELILTAGRAAGLDLLNVVVWVKTNGGMGSLWRSRHEMVPVFKKPGAAHVNNVELGKYGRWRSNIWEHPGASSLGSDSRYGLADHPTVKPVALLEDALLDVTDSNDLVLEPFAGSGSTLIACQTTGRRCRAVEIDPHYVDVVVRRWQALTGKMAFCEETGATFDQIAPGASPGLSETATIERGGA